MMIELPHNINTRLARNAHLLSPQYFPLPHAVLVLWNSHYSMNVSIFIPTRQQTDRCFVGVLSVKIVVTLLTL